MASNIKIINSSSSVTINIDGAIRNVPKNLFIIDHNYGDVKDLISIWVNGDDTTTPFIKELFTKFTFPSGAISAEDYVHAVHDFAPEIRAEYTLEQILARGNGAGNARVYSVSPTSPNRTIKVNILGRDYYIHAKTSND